MIVCTPAEAHKVVNHFIKSICTLRERWASRGGDVNCYGNQPLGTENSHRITSQHLALKRSHTQKKKMKMKCTKEKTKTKKTRVLMIHMDICLTDTVNICTQAIYTQSWNELTLKIVYSAWTQQVKLQVWMEAWWWSRGQIEASHFLNVNDCHEQENITFADLQNYDPLSIYAGAIITLKV